MAGQYLYHGTSDKYLETIRKVGICPTAVTGETLTYWRKVGRAVLWREDAVYTSPSTTTAWGFADQAVMSLGGKQVVFSFYSGSFKKPAGCKVQRRGNEVNFIGCGCIPTSILGYQTERPSSDEIMISERMKSPIGRWERLTERKKR